jgi:hypothetical protein
MTDSNWQDFWEHARNADILEVAGRLFGAKLKRSGADWVGACPNGCAKTDGFVVTPKRRIFFCRPSGAAGDVIKMVEHLKECSAVEAGELITGLPRPDRTHDETDEERRARQAAMDERLSNFQRQKEEEQRQIEAAKEKRDEEAIAYVRKHGVAIPDSPQGKAYFETRGLTPHPRLTKDILFVPQLDYFGARANGDGAIVRLATLPAVVAVIRDATGEVTGYSAIYLDPIKPEKWKPEGSPSNSPTKVRGDKRGGLILLGRAGERLAISEGWANALAWHQLGHGPEDIALAAAVDLGNLVGKATGSAPHPTLKDANGKPVRIANGVPDPSAPGMILRKGVKAVWLIADYDSEVFATAARMAIAVRRLIDMGLEVHIHFPPTPDLDWNDQLLKGDDGAQVEPEPLPPDATYAEKVAAFRHPTHMETGAEYLERVSFLFDPPPPPKAGKFKLVPFEDIKFVATEEWRIKKLLPRQGVAPLFGASKGFKSFVAIDLGLHVALGWDWAGRRTVQGAVVYIAAENSAGTRKRKVGFEMAHADRLPPRVPFSLIEAAPNLGTEKNDREALIASVEAMGVAPALIIVDTLAQSLGGADENNVGMMTFLGNVTALANHFKCCVVPVHHVPLADDKRMRGHTSLQAGVDALWRVERTNGELATTLWLDKLKDEEDGVTLIAHLVRIVIGHDEDNVEISTLVVAGFEDGAPEQATKGKVSESIPRQRRLLMEVLDQAINQAGKDFLSFINGSVVRAVSEEAVRLRYYIRIAEQAEPNEDAAKVEERRRKAFNRSVKAAIDAKDVMASGREGVRMLWLP